VIVTPQDYNPTGNGIENNPWGNGCVESAINACPIGGNVYLKAGYYQLTGIANIPKPMNIIGDGIDKTIILTANNQGLYGESCKNVAIKRLTIDGKKQITDGTTYLTCMAFNYSDYMLFEDIEVKNSARYGWDGNDNNHCTFKNFHAHDNYRHGIHPMANKAGTNMYNTYQDVYCWDNGVNGISDIGSEDYPDEDCYNIYDNIQCWNNGTYGLQISRMHNVTISNSSFNGNGGYGLFLYDDEDFDLANVITKNNNVNNTGNFSGILISLSARMTFKECQSFDDREPKLQNYGLYLSETNTGISLINCILLPNKLGDIYNPNGAEIVIINN